jgi:hypothetical protein
MPDKGMPRYLQGKLEIWQPEQLVMLAMSGRRGVMELFSKFVCSPVAFPNTVSTSLPASNHSKFSFTKPPSANTPMNLSRCLVELGKNAIEAYGMPHGSESLVVKISV